MKIILFCSAFVLYNVYVLHLRVHSSKIQKTGWVVRKVIFLANSNNGQFLCKKFTIILLNYILNMLAQNILSSSYSYQAIYFNLYLYLIFIISIGLLVVIIFENFSTTIWVINANCRTKSLRTIFGTVLEHIISIHFKYQFSCLNSILI